MVNKQKRQLYNRRYYAKKTQQNLLQLATIDEINSPIEIDETHVSEIKQIIEYKPHIFMVFFVHLFNFLKFKVFKWLKP